MAKGEVPLPSLWERVLNRKVLRRLPVEFGLFALAYYAYVVTKNLIHEDPSFYAFLNASSVINLEIDLGIFKEAALQVWLLANAKWVVVFLNWVYFLGFMPVIGATALVTYFLRRDLYYKYRNIMLISFVFALVIFLVFPLAPPRFLPIFGFVDTLQALGPFSHSGGSSMLVSNQFAAMPSMHYGWTLMIALLWAEAGRAWLKALAFVYQGLMFAAVIITGNHYFLDPLAGTGIILASILTCKWLSTHKLPMFRLARFRSR